MHPAKSVVIFTTASGAGYGLLVWLALFGYTGMIEPGPVLGFGFGFGFVAYALAFGLIIIGLLSSMLHLGHPERAWRAMSQWRSSWLSREGLAAIITFIPAGLHAASWIFLGDNGGTAAMLGLIGALLALLTVFCTAMIYASLKAIPAWHNTWTPPAYLGLSLMSGALLINLMCNIWSHAAANITYIITLILIAFGLAIKLLYWRSVVHAAPVSTAGTATGLGQLGRVQLLDPPHGTDNYLMKEMGFRIARKHAARLRLIAITCGFIAPFLLVWLGGASEGITAIVAAALAVLSGAVGITIERWLFFAEAKHVVQLYYGESKV